MAASSFPPEPISGKIIHVISAQYIFYLQCYSGKINTSSVLDKYITYMYVTTRLKSDITWGKVHSTIIFKFICLLCILNPEDCLSCTVYITEMLVQV